MPNCLAEVMNWILKYELVIKDDAEEIRTINWETEKKKRK
jgi:hypothetical protein